MGTLEDAGKAANEIIEKVIDFTEEIAVKTVDVLDVISEATFDFAQNAQEFVSETEEFLKKKAAEASAAASGTKPKDAEQGTAGKMEDKQKEPGAKE